LLFFTGIYLAYTTYEAEKDNFLSEFPSPGWLTIGLMLPLPTERVHLCCSRISRSVFRISCSKDDVV